MDAHILWYNYNADLCSAEMTHHFHSHCFSKLPHSGGTCVSTFCTDIPFDAVPTDAAGFHIENEAQIPPPPILYLPHFCVTCFHYLRLGTACSLLCGVTPPADRPRSEIKNYNSLRRMAMEQQLRNSSHQQSHLHRVIFRQRRCFSPP